MIEAKNAESDNQQSNMWLPLSPIESANSLSISIFLSLPHVPCMGIIFRQSNYRRYLLEVNTFECLLYTKREQEGYQLIAL